ncbi:hypothetical protein DXG01_006846 [Tephrocybe rancida]|nr:hypothetical protein DXG01_006846 [Tephrocybe rancida]
MEASDSDATLQWEMALTDPDKEVVAERKQKLSDLKTKLSNWFHYRFKRMDTEPKDDLVQDVLKAMHNMTNEKPQKKAAVKLYAS